MSSNKNLTEDLRSVSVAEYIKHCCPSWNMSGEPIKLRKFESSKIDSHKSGQKQIALES